MRVRMLKQFEDSVSHAEHGTLTLVFAAGSTQHFDDATAETLATSGAAQKDPEPSERVRMLRTITAVELAEHVGAPIDLGIERLEKGLLIHVPHDVVKAITAEATPEGARLERLAELAPDPEYRPIEASRQAAIDAAIARKQAADAAEQRRAAVKAQSTAAMTTPAKSTTKTKTAAAPSAAPASAASTSSTPTEG